MTVISDPVVNFKSTLELTANAHNCENSPQTNVSDNNYENNHNDSEANTGSKVLRIVWHALYEKYENFRKQTKLFKNLVNRESNKPLAKKFRHSLRLNKSAKKKGYKYFLSDEDQR